MTTEADRAAAEVLLDQLANDGDYFSASQQELFADAFAAHREAHSAPAVVSDLASMTNTCLNVRCNACSRSLVGVTECDSQCNRSDCAMRQLAALLSGPAPADQDAREISRKYTGGAPGLVGDIEAYALQVAAAERERCAVLEKALKDIAAEPCLGKWTEAGEFGIKHGHCMPCHATAALSSNRTAREEGS